MKKALLLSMLACSATWSAAQEVGRVISSTPVVQQTAVPRQVCSQEQVVVQQSRSGAGAAMGAIAGGAVGNAFGSGGGRALATLIGVVGGALLGDRVEGSPTPQVQQVQNCSMQSFLENRVVGYNVQYEYAGKQYSVQMPTDPGPTIALQVTPVGRLQAPPATYGSPTAYRAPVQAPVRVAGPAQTAFAQPWYAARQPASNNWPRTGGEDFSGF